MFAWRPGAQLISEFARRKGEIVCAKRVFGAFDGTGLDEQLKQRGVDEVFIGGQHTCVCVRHSAYGAFIRVKGTTIPRIAACVRAGERG